jgi:large subunit ribosomal protein L3
MKPFKGIIGKKVGMTRIFDKDGNVIPVTVISVQPGVVMEVKRKEKHGYDAVKVAFEPVKLEKLIKPLRGEFEKRNFSIGYRILKEFRVDSTEGINVGDEVTLDIFKEGDIVKVSGYSKGRGFQGVMKRFGFKGGPDAHGSMFHRRPGSIGMHTDPGRVLKGKKLPGRMGNKRVTIRNLKVVGILKEKNFIYIKGAVPGAPNSILEIYKT